MIQELASVVLNVDLPEHGLKEGDIDTEPGQADGQGFDSFDARPEEVAHPAPDGSTPRPLRDTPGSPATPVSVAAELVVP